MRNEKFYSAERNIEILLALLKANGIRKIIASPGATNYSLVGSVQNDSWFEVYSSVDERSAAYMACGMAAESGEPVVLSCTGATASRNYLPGLSEAYYRKLPVLAVTSHQGSDRIGQLIPQNIDRRRAPADVATLQVELPVVRDSRDEAYVTMQANKAVLELRRNGGGPVHVNIFTTYSNDFSVKTLPAVRVMRRYMAWDTLPALSEGRIGIYVGSHARFSPSLTAEVDRFCATYDAIVICDHTSGYYGRYRLQPTLVELQTDASNPLPTLDLMVHIGEVSAATFAGHIPCREIWRVSEDGELRDPFKHLTAVFQMPEETFFRHYGKDEQAQHGFIDACRETCNAIYDSIPELPFSNMWAAQQLSSRLPANSMIHIGVSNTRRCWNIFPLPESVESVCNVGCCGIDGCSSSLVGASLVHPERVYFGVFGDLTFFYDMNVIGNRHVGPNVRIMLVNNGCGAEFRLYSHYCRVFGEDASPYMAAAGHFGNKSRDLVRHYAEDLGYQYLSATNKDEFLAAVDTFTSLTVGDRPMLFEIFTRPEDESDALKLMSTIVTEATVAARRKMVSAVKSVAGEKGSDVLRKLFKK